MKYTISRKILLPPIILLFPLVMFAQEKCNDIIYPTGVKSSILNCCIYMIKDGNVVYFVKDGDSSLVAAVKIIKDGVERRLTSSRQRSDTPKQVNDADGVSMNATVYKQEDYKRYEKLYFKGKKIRNLGIALTIFGAGGIVIGVKMNKGKIKNNNPEMPAYVIISGFTILNLGIPLTISGEIMRANNKMEMEEIERNANLSIGINQDGIGIKVRF